MARSAGAHVTSRPKNRLEHLESYVSTGRGRAPEDGNSFHFAGGGRHEHTVRDARPTLPSQPAGSEDSGARGLCTANSPKGLFPHTIYSRSVAGDSASDTQSGGLG